MSNSLAAAEERFSHVTRNSSVMAIGTFGSRVLGFVRTFLFIMIVHSSVAADAFTQANNLPTAIYAVIATGVVSGVLIPQITKAMKRDDGGEDFVNRLLTLSLLVIGAAAIICTLCAPWLVNMVVAHKANLATPGYLHLAILLGYWCMPQVFFYGLYTVLGQVLNARGHFAAFAWAPAMANVVQIAGLIGFWLLWGYQPSPTNWSTAMIVLLGGSTTLGIAVQGLYMIWPLYREGFRFHPRFGWRGYGFGEVSKMTFWTSAAVVVSFIEGLVISWAISATRAGVSSVGGNSTQQYAYTLAILPHSLVMVSVATALFPALARAWDTRDTAKVKDLVTQGLVAPAMWIIPASIGLIGLGMPVINTLYATLSPTEAFNVWGVTAAYSLGTWAYAITALKQRYYFAKQDGWTNLWLVLVMLAAELAAVFIAVWALPGEFGVVSIALGRTVGSVVAAGLFLAMVQREVGGYGLRRIAASWGKVTIASVVAAGVAWTATYLVGLISHRRLMAPVELVVGGIVFVVALVTMAEWLGIAEITSFARQALDRIRGVKRPDVSLPEDVTYEDTAEALPLPQAELDIETTMQVIFRPPPPPVGAWGARVARAYSDPDLTTQFRWRPPPPPSGAPGAPSAPRPPSPPPVYRQPPPIPVPQPQPPQVRLPPGGAGRPRRAAPDQPGESNPG